MVDEFIILRGKWRDSQGAQYLAQRESFGLKGACDWQDSSSGLLELFAHEAVGWPVSAIRGWGLSLAQDYGYGRVGAKRKFG